MQEKITFRRAKTTLKPWILTSIFIQAMSNVILNFMKQFTEGLGLKISVAVKKPLFAVQKPPQNFEIGAGNLSKLCLT